MTTKVFRSILHGLALTVSNFLGIFGAFVLYVAFFRPGPQIPLQLPVAVLFSAALFAAWLFLLRGRAVPHTPGEYVAIYLAAFALFPAVFIPAHYLTQGYLTAFGNIVAVWCFQAPVNAAVLLFAYRLPRSRRVPATSA